MFKSEVEQRSGPHASHARVLCIPLHNPIFRKTELASKCPILGGLRQQSHSLPVLEARILGPNCGLGLAALGCSCPVFCGRCPQDCHLHRIYPLFSDCSATRYPLCAEPRLPARVFHRHRLHFKGTVCSVTSSTTPQTGYIFMKEVHLGSQFW